MSGPRILALVLLAALVLLWVALFGGTDSDLARGLEETNQVFALIESELLELDPLYKEVTRRGLMLALKSRHDSVRSRLATLKARQRHIARDDALSRRERLPALRELRDEADVVLANALGLHRQLRARYEFMVGISPGLEEARRLDQQLRELVPEGDMGVAALVQSMTGSFAEIEASAKRTDALMQQNLQQGQVMGETTRRQLDDLIEEQRELLARLEERG